MTSRKTILVTGSSGTVGTGVVLELLKRGYDVIPLDIKHSLWDTKIDRKTVIHDLRKPIGNLRKTPDIIIHLAANARVHDLVVTPRLALDNYIMTYHVLEYARNHSIKRIIFSSSREVYGESKTGKKRKEESTHVSMIKSPYTASKFGAEALIHAYRECYNIKPVIVRLSNVYGKYDVSERVVPLFIYYARRNREIRIFGKEKKLDFTYIDDCVDGIIRIVTRFNKAAGKTFNISCGKSERLLDLAKMIVAYLNSKSKISILSKRTGEISSYTGDITLAHNLLEYNPKVSLKDGLPKAIDWYLEVIRESRIYQTQRRNLTKRHWA